MPCSIARATSARSSRQAAWLAGPARPAPRLDRRLEAKVETLRARQRPDTGDDWRELVGTRREPLQDRPERRASQLVAVDEDVVTLLGPDRGERHDRIAVRDRQCGKAGAPLPDQVVLLALVLEDLAGAARKDEDRLAGAHQRLAVLARAVDGTEAGEQIAPQRHLEMRVIAERAHDHAAEVVQPEQHERHVEHAHQRVIADEQKRPIGRHLVDVVEERRREQAPRLEEDAGRRHLDRRGTAADDGPFSHSA